MACRANDIPDGGDFLEYEIAGLSIVIVRQASGEVRAFRNACRHRGTALATGNGNAACFQCPFHGWTFGIDGALQALPAAWDFPHVDRAQYGLAPVLAEVFDGWVFVNLDVTAPPLAEFLGDTVMRHLLVHPDGAMWKEWHFGRVVAANWKVMAEAFFESYHVSRTHWQVAPFGGDVQSRYDMFGRHHRMSMLTMVASLIGGGVFTEEEVLQAGMGLQRSYRNVEEQPTADGPAAPEFFLPDGMTARQFVGAVVRQQWLSKGVDLSTVSDAELIDGIIYLVFPNLMPFRNPGGHHVYRFRPNGDDPGSCIFEVMNLVPLPPTQARPRDTPLRMLDLGETLADLPELAGGNVGYILEQDVRNSTLIQKGLRVSGTITLGQRQERNIVAFHHHLARWISGE